MRSLVPGAGLYACTAAPVCSVAAGTSADFNLGGWASAGSDYRVTEAADTYVYKTGLFNKYNYAALLARVRAGVNPAAISSPVSLGDPPIGWSEDPAGSGIYWARVQGGASVNGATVANSKLILLVDGTVNISGSITIPPANRTTGNVVIISGGNITLGGGVTNIDGIYVTDGTFDTGLSNNQLTVNGTVVAWGGLTLARNAVNNSTTPAEVFNFVPDFVVNLPEPVRRRHIVQELENP